MIRDNKDFNIDTTLIKPFEHLYGLASNLGLRHGSNKKSLEVDLPTAIFVLTTCSALLNLLAVKIELRL